MQYKNLAEKDNLIDSPGYPIASVISVACQGGLLKEDARKLFATNLKVLVERDGYSRAGLATYLSVPVSMVSRWLAGRILPTKHIESIAEYLDVSIATLFRSDFTPLPSSRDLTLDEAFRALANALGYTVRRQSGEK